jgi:hypothetical protein
MDAGAIPASSTKKGFSIDERSFLLLGTATTPINDGIILCLWYDSKVNKQIQKVGLHGYKIR